MLKATLTLLVCSLFISAEPIEDYSKLKEKIQLVKRTKRPKYYEKRLGKIKNSRAVEAAKQLSFKNWKTYGDEFISFKYPDSEFIKLKKENEHYLLMIEDEVYLSLSLFKREGFSEDDCFCGAIVYSKYLFHNDSLYLFDFLEHGDYKRIQIQKDDYLIYTHWTHQLIPQDIYVDLMLSVKLKKGSNENVIKLHIAANNSGTLSFKKGMTQQEVIKLLGKPTEQTKDQLKFVKVSSYDWSRNQYEETETIDFVNGKLEFITPDWFKSKEILVKGSIDWMKSIVNGSDDDFGDEDEDEFASDSEENSQLDEKTVEYTFNRIIELLPITKDTDEYEDLGTLYRVIDSLFEKGYDNKKIKKVLLKRAFEKDSCAYNCAYILQKYDYANLEIILETRMRKLLKTHKAEHLWSVWAGNDPEGNEIEFYFDDLAELFTEESKVFKELILEALDSTNKQIKESALSYLDTITPTDKTHKYFKEGLSHYNSYVQMISAKGQSFDFSVN